MALWRSWVRSPSGPHFLLRRGGGTGRRTGLKIQRAHAHKGSTPFLGKSHPVCQYLAVPILLNLLEIGTVPASHKN